MLDISGVEPFCFFKAVIMWSPLIALDFFGLACINLFRNLLPFVAVRQLCNTVSDGAWDRSFIMISTLLQSAALFFSSPLLDMKNFNTNTVWFDIFEIITALIFHRTKGVHQGYLFFQKRLQNCMFKATWDKTTATSRPCTFLNKGRGKISVMN